MLKRNLLFTLGLHCFLITFSQNVYKVKLEGCDTQRFALESNKRTAKIDKQVLDDFISQYIVEQVKSKIKGTLKLQVIVYKDGTSCLISYENLTNVKSEELDFDKIKHHIDSTLKWENDIENAAALIEIKFKRKKFVVKRFGFNGKIGWHEL